MQWCHGAPGIVTSLAGLAPDDDAYGGAAERRRRARLAGGPVADNAGLCHGTAGNGFAFLALGSERATSAGSSAPVPSPRTASTRSTRFRAAHGRGRYSLFTGDLGAALLAAACLTRRRGFPGIDDL